MTLAQAKILIVDDEPVLRLTFSVLLQQHGATVHIASNGKEALQQLEREPVDVMLTDQQMPVMDGKTLLRTMYKNRMRVPSILFVNAVEPEDQEELRQLSVVETVTKPLHPEALVALLERVLASSLPR